jgi:hypothetical protein
VETLGDIVHISVQKTAQHQAALDITAHLTEMLPVRQTFALGPNVEAEVYTQAVTAAREADTVIVSLFNPRTVYVDNGPLLPQHADLLQSVIEVKPTSTVIMSYGNPYLVETVDGSSAFVVGYGEGGFYGNQTVYGEAFARLLKGEISATGTLPILLPDNSGTTEPPTE